MESPVEISRLDEVFARDQNDNAPLPYLTLRDDVIAYKASGDKPDLLVYNRRWLRYSNPFFGSISDLAASDTRRVWCLKNHPVTQVGCLDLESNRFTIADSVHAYDKIVYSEGNFVWLRRRHQPIIDECVITPQRIQRTRSIHLQISDAIDNIAYFPNQKRFFAVGAFYGGIHSADITGKSYTVSLPQRRSDAYSFHPADVYFVPPFIVAYDSQSNAVYYSTDPDNHWMRFTLDWDDALRRAKVSNALFVQSRLSLQRTMSGELFGLWSRHKIDEDIAVSAFVQIGTRARVIEAFSGQSAPTIQALGDYIGLYWLDNEDFSSLIRDKVPRKGNVMIYEPKQDRFHQIMPREAIKRVAHTLPRRDWNVRRNDIPGVISGAPLSLSDTPIKPIGNVAPQSIAAACCIADGRIAVMSKHCARISILDAGKWRSYEIPERVPASSPLKVTADSPGRIWYVESTEEHLLSIDIDSATLRAFFTGLKFPSGILAVHEPLILLCDGENDSLIEYSCMDKLLKCEKSIRVDGIVTAAAAAPKDGGWWVSVHTDTKQYELRHVMVPHQAVRVIMQSNNAITIARDFNNRPYLIIYDANNMIVKFTYDPDKEWTSLALPDGVNGGTPLSYAKTHDKLCMTLLNGNDGTYLLASSDERFEAVAKFPHAVDCVPAGSSVFLWRDAPITGIVYNDAQGIPQNSGGLFYLPSASLFSSTPFISCQVNRHAAARLPKIRIPDLWAAKGNAASM